MKGEGWRVGRGQPGVFGTGKRRLAWMRLNGYTETGKMLNLSIS